ncbi:MAG: hypothetical protein R3C44_02445 [Chloroflexota bacterium]
MLVLFIVLMFLIVFFIMLVCMLASHILVAMICFRGGNWCCCLNCRRLGYGRAARSQNEQKAASGKKIVLLIIRLFISFVSTPDRLQ